MAGFDFVSHRCERPAVKECRMPMVSTRSNFYCEEHCPEPDDGLVVYAYGGPMQCMYTIATVAIEGEEPDQ